MPVVQQPEFYLTFAGQKFDENGKLTDEATKQHIGALWQAHVELFNKIR